jgi:hypothetical protein
VRFALGRRKHVAFVSCLIYVSPPYLSQTKSKTTNSEDVLWFPERVKAFDPAIILRPASSSAPSEPAAGSKGASAAAAAAVVRGGKEGPPAVPVVLTMHV